MHEANNIRGLCYIDPRVDPVNRSQLEGYDPARSVGSGFALGIDAMRRQNGVQIERMRALIGSRMWRKFLDEIQAGSFCVTRDGKRLVEGIDFTFDRERGVISIKPHALNGTALDVTESVQVSAVSPERMPATPARREAQWKAERRGRRA